MSSNLFLHIGVLIGFLGILFAWGSRSFDLTERLNLWTRVSDFLRSLVLKFLEVIDKTGSERPVSLRIGVSAAPGGAWIQHGLRDFRAGLGHLETKDWIGGVFHLSSNPSKAAFKSVRV